MPEIFPVGTFEERGMAYWQKMRDFSPLSSSAHQQRMTTVYGLPLCNDFLNNLKVLYYIIWYIFNSKKHQYNFVNSQIKFF